jgi:hypothetical protein
VPKPTTNNHQQHQEENKMTVINLRNGRSIVTDHIVSFLKIGNETRFHLSNGEVVTGDPWSDPAESFVRVIPAAPGLLMRPGST